MLLNQVKSYYESNSIDDILKCSSCKSKFADEIRMISECGNSICGSCYRSLCSRVDEAGKFTCVECQEPHIMPKNGLALNKALMKMLKIKPQEKALNEREKLLKSSIDEVELLLKELKSMDEREQIINYCEGLVNEVTTALNNAINHLKSTSISLIGQIDEYKASLLNSLEGANAKRAKLEDGSSETTSLKESLEAIAADYEALNQEWNGYFAQLGHAASEWKLSAATDQAILLKIRLSQLEVKLKDRVLSQHSLVFKPNDKFIKSSLHLGELANERPQLDAPNIDEPKKIGLDSNGGLIEAHELAVRKVIFLANGSLASASDDKTIKVWSGKSGRLLAVLTGHTEAVLTVIQIANGWLASGSADNSIILWDLAEKKQVRKLVGHVGKVFALQNLPNKTLASCSLDNMIKIWNPYAAGSCVISTLAGHSVQVLWQMGMMSSGNLVTCNHNVRAKDSYLKMWNPYNGGVTIFMTGAWDASAILVLSTDDVAVGFTSGHIKVMNLKDSHAKPISMADVHQGGVHNLLELPNARLVSTGMRDNPILKIWNLITGELIKVIKTEHETGICAMSFSKQSKRLALGSYDKRIQLMTLDY